MKRARTAIALLLSILALSGKSQAQEGLPALEGPYLGQRPPGLTPELFAPGIVSTGHLEIEGVFAPGMDEFYFTRQVDRDVPRTHAFRYQDGVWKQFMDEPRSGEVALSTDGRTMYLGNRYRERTASGWSEIKSLGPLFEKFPIMRLTASAAGTYVFDEREEIGTIRDSRLLDGERETPKALGEAINSGTRTAHPFIAADESYLIWDGEREGGYGNADLYISFRQQDGSWGPAINMGEDINTEHEDAYGSVTPDGKYFFFHTVEWNEGKTSIEGANIFWVDARVMERLRPEP